MGAWIEIYGFVSQGCIISVAPYMGAWIEIKLIRIHNFNYIVAPYMGAWIEIVESFEWHDDKVSLPTWGRGLKSLYYC